jgi:stage II sporulation protein E
MLKLSLARPFRYFGFLRHSFRFWANTGAIAVLSFLLAKAALMGELYPFGTSFLAGVCIVRPGLRLAALAGVLMGTALETTGWESTSYILSIFLIYIVLSRRNKEENHWLLVPCLVAAVQLLVRGTIVFFTANEIYQWVGVLFESFFTGILTLVVLSGLQAYPRIRRGESLNPEERTSLGLIIMGALIGVAQVEYFGIGFQSVLSRLLILWGAFLGGPGGGAAVGVGVGLVPSIQGTISTGPIAIYGLAGMLGGMFNNFKKTGVVIGFMLSVLFMSLFFAEQIFIEQAIRETVLAIILFYIFKIPEMKFDMVKTIPEVNIKRENNLEIIDKLKRMAHVFYELGKTFHINKEEVNKEEVNKEDLNEVFNKVATRVCEGCSLHRVCWEQDFYKTYRAILDACTHLEKEGIINEKQFGTSLKRRCMRLRELRIALNSEVEHLKLINSYQKQIAGCRDMVYNQLINLAKVIEDFSGDINKEIFNKGKPNELLKKKLEEKGILINDIQMVDLGNGEMEIVVSQDSCREKDWCKTMVAPNISQITGRNYRIKSAVCRYGDNKGCTYRLIPGSCYNVRVGQALCPKDGQKVSGDICAAFALSEQRFALVMSDGMGTGKEAHIESDIAVNLLEKLLMAGFSSETAVNTINTVLFLRSGKESFVTLDLALINRVNGYADFVKIGGAPSLISTANGLSVVQAQSPPAGILDKIEMQTFQHLLRPSNVIIMMSDGVWEAINNAGGPAGWFEDVLRRMDLDNPQQIADNILYLAKKASAEKTNDDMCVQVAKIEVQEIA